uniref:Uncharacterized protein n=1 Tax=Trichobilharzia regenti TaxID=157069 RepID=A0AA85K277_TRIRE|nr:unnamed protein product [Trichobilharzia regenti]
MPNDTRRELLLGIDNMLSELIQAVRLERKAYDHTFNESDKLPGINKVPESHMTHTKSKNEKPFQSTVCKATQTLPQPATSHLFDLPKTNIKSNAKYASQRKFDVAKHSSTNISPSLHQSCLLKSHCCEVVGSDNYYTTMSSSHSSSLFSCSCKYYQERYSTPRYPNVDLTPSGYISSKHIKNPVNKCCISSTSGCSTGCSTCCRKYSNYSPSNELLLHCKSDYSCSCYMHTSF